jgi:hypothetical protein
MNNLIVKCFEGKVSGVDNVVVVNSIEALNTLLYKRDLNKYLAAFSAFEPSRYISGNSMSSLPWF